MISRSHLLRSRLVERLRAFREDADRVGHRQIRRWLYAGPSFFDGLGFRMDVPRVIAIGAGQRENLSLSRFWQVAIPIPGS